MTMKVPAQIVVRGHSGYLIVPIVAIPAATGTAFTYYRDNLPSFCLENAEKVIGTAALLTFVLMVVAAFLRARRVEGRGNQLHYHSWLQDRAVSAATISAVTFETEVAVGSDNDNIEHYLSLWCGKEVALKFNSRLWPQSGMSQLLRWLKERVPALRMDLAVERYMSEKS
jgi:hypothetical protein